MNIDRKLIAAHLGSIMVFALVIGVLGYQTIQDSLVKAGDEKLRLLLTEVLDDVNEELEEYGQVVGGIIDSRAMSIYLDEFDDRPLLDILRQQDVKFDQISLLNERGREELRFVDGALRAADVDFSYDENVLDARWTPNVPVISLQPVSEERAAILIVSQVKQDFFDEFGGSLRATHRLSAFFKAVVSIPDSAFLLITDPQGRLIFDINTGKWRPKEGQVVDCAVTSPKAAFSRCDGLVVFKWSQPLNYQGWLLTAGIPGEVFLGPLHRTRNNMLLVLGVLVLAVVLVSLWLARHIQQPLAQLVSASRQIAQGAPGVEVAIERGDELGELGHAFNAMSHSLQSSNKRIEYMAYNDELTGLPNRRLMLNRLEKALASGVRHGQRGALIMLDLDRFKNINDSLGHAAGDEFLKQVGKRLTTIVRNEDTVCRLGGDEFVVLLPYIEKDGDDILGPTALIAGKILEQLSQPYQIGNNRYVITPSIGIVLFPHLDDNADNLLKRADAAMYRSKRDGGNRISFYEKSIQQAADERLALEKDLRQAFDDREIALAFQPQYDARGSIVGVEALARWQHPSRGMVPPPRFIGVAEEIGMIVPLGTWILDEACRQFTQLMAIGLDPLPTLSVNVSAFQFHDAGFVDQVLSLVRRHQLPTHSLQLELTESALLQDLDSTVQRMKQLRKGGIHLSLDDFGTGYSSLSYLSRLPLDEVKIDRSFLIDAESNVESWAIIESIIDIAGVLGLRVVAEGVERVVEVERLSAIGCKVFQGYHFAKPDSFSKFQSLLISQSDSQSGLVS